MSSAGLGSGGCGLFGAVLALGCASLPTGVPRPLPATETREAARASTAQVDGLRVLWNAVAIGRASEQTWVANDPAELAVLWREAGPSVEMPTVDFTRYVVLGLSHWGSYCQPEISSVSVERSGVVRLNTERDTSICMDVAVRVSLVIALPRRLLKPSILLVAPGYRHAFEFSVPTASPSADERELPEPRASATAAPQLEPVPLPPVGHLALATMHDGSEVWVAHEANGAVSVVAAVASLRPWLLSGFPDYLESAVQWSPELGRFQGGWDWRGHSVHGFSPLTPHRFQLDARGQLWVGAPIEALPAPIRPRKDAPQLDGRARAYTTLRRSTWRDLHEGEFALVDLDLVSLPALGVTLCKVPKQTTSSTRFRNCPRDAPRVLGAPDHPRAPAFVLYGPFVVRRVGNAARVVVTAALAEKALLRE